MTWLPDELATSQLERGDLGSRMRRLGDDFAASNLSDRLIGLVSVLCFLVLWEVAASRGWINPQFLSAPTRIVRAMVQAASDGSLWRHTAVSASELVLGYGLAAAVGIPLGMLAGWYRRFSAVISPFVSGGYITPRIALVPIIILWFGIGPASKIALVFIMAVFAIVIPVAAGMRSLDSNLTRVGRAFGAGDLTMFVTIGLPASVPYIIAGLQLGLGLGLAGVVVGEFYAATAGLGYLIMSTGSTFQTDLMFAAVIVLVVSVGALMAVLGLVERHFSRWRPPRA